MATVAAMKIEQHLLPENGETYRVTVTNKHGAQYDIHEHTDGSLVVVARTDLWARNLNVTTIQLKPGKP